MNQNLPVKILKDENDRPFVPFTTSDAVFINGTDDTIQDVVEGKQDTLVSGTNIKTINNESILGSGNIDIQGGGSSIQVSELPTASASELGKIYQYIGNDTADYDNGYFYKCKKETNIEHLTTTPSTSIPLDFALNNTNYSVEMDLKLLDLSRSYYYARLMFGANDEYNSALYMTKVNTADIYLYAGCGGNNTNVFIYTKPEYRTTIKYNLYDEAYGSYTCKFSDDWIMSGFNANNDNNNITLFNSHTTDPEGAPAELYGFRVYDNSTSPATLIHNLVPRLNNNVPSLYDTITQTYYTDTSSTMTYTAGGDVYAWNRVDVQPGALRVCETPYEPYVQISDAATLRDLQNIINDWVQNNKIMPYMIDDAMLNNLWLNDSDEWSDYKQYVLEFNGLNSTTSIRSFRLVFYTHYNNDTIYDNTNENYYPRFEGESTSYLTQSYELFNCMRKDNTEVYVPQYDYNPATKIYVDDVKNHALYQYSTMPIADKENEIVQYKGVTNANYTNSCFYKSKVSPNTVPVLKINTGSKFDISYQFQDTDRVELKFKPTVLAYDNGVLGNHEYNPAYMEVHFYEARFFIGTGTEQLEQNIYEQNKLYDIVINDNNGNIYVNNEVFASATNYASFGTLQLFDYNGNTDFRGDFYYLKIYDKTTGNLKKEWVPALDQNNVPCIYETVGQTYIYNEYDNTGNAYQEVPDGYIWELETGYLRPEVITNSDSTYTIANLKEHQLYNLGEIIALTITTVDNIYVESNIFLESGATPTAVSLPSSIENIGDAPTMTTASSVNTGTLTANKKYIISFLNGVAVWKEY